MNTKIFNSFFFFFLQKVLFIEEKVNCGLLILIYDEEKEKQKN